MTVMTAVTQKTTTRARASKIPLCPCCEAPLQALIEPGGNRPRAWYPCDQGCAFVACPHWPPRPPRYFVEPGLGAAATHCLAHRPVPVSSELCVKDLSPAAQHRVHVVPFEIVNGFRNYRRMNEHDR